VSPPPVSICLTAYNRGRSVGTSIEALLAQTFEDFELIISDDCSTDDTEAICRGYAAKDPRVRYFRNAENLKMPGNLNAAIARASGEYVANVHDGDVYRPDLIEKWKTALDAVPTAAFVFNQYEMIGRDGSRRISASPFELRVDGREIAQHFFRTFTSCVWGTVMARRSAYARTRPFDARYGFISDVDMWLRLAHDHDAAYVAEPLLTLEPREPDHPYAFVHWRHEFWTLAIYAAHLSFFRDVLPDDTRRFRAAFPGRRRRMLLRDMAICVRHRRWDRVREGLAIWRDADDRVLRALGRGLGRPGDAPEWYRRRLWDDATPSA
jgi:glycosyltransferase involved in cell wall biosynthesis